MNSVEQQFSIYWTSGHGGQWFLQKQKANNVNPLNAAAYDLGDNAGYNAWLGTFSLNWVYRFGHTDGHM